MSQEKIYTLEFSEMLPDIFEHRSVFIRSFGGTVQVVPNASQTDQFLNLKVTDTAVVMQSYDTGANVAFGTGTDNSSRFGPRQEIIATDKQVPYEAPLAIHEGIDHFTANDDVERAVAERLAENAVAWATYVDGLLSAAISTGASKTFTGNLDEAGVTAAFSEAHIMFVNNGVSRTVNHVAYVTPKVFDIIVDSDLASTGKNSRVNIDDEQIYGFKGFTIVEAPEDKFQTGEQIYFVADRIGVAGIGVNIARSFDAHDFYGTTIQSAAKYGKYIPEANEQAIAKAKLTAPTPTKLSVEDTSKKGK